LAVVLLINNVTSLYFLVYFIEYYMPDNMSSAS